MGKVDESQYGFRNAFETGEIAFNKGSRLEAAPPLYIFFCVMGNVALH
jgi:hypothetical protein